MLVTILFAILLISANVFNRTEGTAFWVYAVSLGLSVLASIVVTMLILSKGSKQLVGSRVFGAVLALCYVLVCGGATMVVRFGIPLERVAYFVAVILGWLAIDRLFSWKDSGRDPSRTHELRIKSSGARYGAASRRQVYEHKHGAESWESSQESLQDFLKIGAFVALVGLFIYLGFYELIGALVITALILLSIQGQRLIR